MSLIHVLIRLVGLLFFSAVQRELAIFPEVKGAIGITHFGKIRLAVFKSSHHLIAVWWLK